MSGAITENKVYVYEAPVRIWHWINAIAIVVLGVTGYFIAYPLPSLSGEASDHYLMGWIRFLHFSAAYAFAIGFLGRIYWAFVGGIVFSSSLGIYLDGRLPLRSVIVFGVFTLLWLLLGLRYRPSGSAYVLTGLAGYFLLAIIMQRTGRKGRSKSL